MLRSLLVLIVAAAAGLAAVSPVHAAAASFPEGSRIGLVLPPGNLTPSKQFPGYEDPAHHVTIALLDLPGRAYAAVEKGAFGNDTKGLMIDKRELFSFAGGLGYLVTGHATVDGRKVHTWYLLANTFSQTAGRIATFVRVHVPDAARAAYPDAAIMAALRSVTFRMPPPDELVGRLPYKIGDLAGFRVMRVTPAALTVLIDGPADDPIKRPFMVIGVGRGAPRDQADRARFARDLLSSAPVQVGKITSAESIRLDNAQVFEIRADAKGPDGTALDLVQWLRFAGSGFVRIIGVVHKQDWDKLFPRFRVVRDSVEIR